MLRHYRRGGLAQRLSERHYLWTGLARTRAVREFELLRALEAEGLPCPVPYACALTRRGPFWRGSLVTRRLPGRTLADALGAPALGGPATAGRLDHAVWAAIGRAIARFHAAGVDHADLNAHNVLIDGDASADAAVAVYLLDFDRARRRRAPLGEITRWQRRNIARLARSLAKLAAGTARRVDAEGFAALETAWTRALRAGPSPQRA